MTPAGVQELLDKRLTRLLGDRVFLADLAAYMQYEIEEMASPSPERPRDLITGRSPEFEYLLDLANRCLSGAPPTMAELSAPCPPFAKTPARSSTAAWLSEHLDARYAQTRFMKKEWGLERLDPATVRLFLNRAFRERQK